MTSLASQLKRLAVPYTQAVFGSDKKRATLLFDPKQAAELDKQSVYAIGISGLEELEGMDPEFSEYHNTLFNLSSQSWERTLQSKEVNTQLDETISSFLLRLSPYLLLTPAHKALEWLIYRYHIHQMNIDALLRCAMPYHETKIFVRIIQLLPITAETNKWFWLSPCGNSGVVLPRLSLIAHCRSDPAFLTFISEMPIAYIKEHGWGSSNLRTVVALWTFTLLGVTDDRTQITERLMGILVPALTRGLKSKCEDLKAGTYMILSQLVSHTVLKPDLLTSLIPLLTKYISPKLTREALLCLTLIIRSQKLQKLPKKCVKRLSSLPAVVETLAILTNKYDMTPLLTTYLHALVPMAMKMTSSVSSSSEDEQEMRSPRQYDVILSGLLTDVSIDTNLATEVATWLLEELVSAVENRPEEEWKSASKAFLSVLQTRYSVSVDLALGRISKSVNAGHLQAVLQAAVGGARGRLIDSSTSLFLALSHADPTTRVLALSHLKEVLSGEEEDWKELELESVIIDRLNEDQYKVVDAALDLDQLLFKVLAPKKLGETLIKVIKANSTKKKWSSRIVKAVNLFCSDAMRPVNQNLGPRLLSCLLLKDQGTPILHLTTPIALLASSLAPVDPFLGSISKVWLGLSEREVDESNVDEVREQLNLTVIHSAARALVKLDTKRRAEVLEIMRAESCEDVEYRMASLCVLHEALSQASTEPTRRQMASLILSILTPYLHSLDKIEAISKKSATVSHHMAYWLHHVSVYKTLPPALILKTLQGILDSYGNKKIKLPTSVWWSMDDGSVRLLVSTLDLLLSVSCRPGLSAEAVKPWHSIIKAFTQDDIEVLTLSRLAGLVWNLHMTRDVSVSPALQVAIGHLVASRWKGLEKVEMLSLLEEDKAPVLPCVVACLGSWEESLRHGALLCVQAAREACSKETGKLSKLFKKVTKQEEEITADKSHIQHILSRVMKSDPDLVKLLLHWLNDNQTPAVIKERLLHHMQTTANQFVLDEALSVGSDILTMCEEEEEAATSTHLGIYGYLIVRYTSEEAASLELSSPRFTFLLSGIHSTYSPSSGGASPAPLAIAQITKDFFHALPSDKEKKALVSAILDVMEKPVNADLGQLAYSTLQKLRLEFEHVQHELTIPEDESSGPKTIKARRRSKPVTAAKPLSWTRITALLEALQTRKSVESSEPMVSTLFSLLILIQQNEGDLWEYRQRLLLAVIHNLTARWQSRQLTPKQESVNVESLVKSVRSPVSSMQTKQHGLAVMANLAHFFPEHLLHHVMSIFTFVGEGLMAADDAHSLSIVSRTITTIIPALLSAGNTAEKDNNQLINQIVQVFVDAQRSVPRHRSLTVFTTLVKTLTPDTSLWRILISLVATATQHRDRQPQDEAHDLIQDVGSMERDLEFGLSVCQQFDLPDQVGTATRVVLFLKWLAAQHGKQQIIPSPKSKAGQKKVEAKREKPVEASVVDVETMSGHQMRLLQFHLTQLITRILTSEDLITQVVEKEERVGETFHQFVKESVMYMLNVASLQHSLTSHIHAKFWKAVMSKAYEILDKVLYLLPTPVLLDVVTTLLAHNLTGVKRKSLDLLASKLQTMLTVSPSEEEEIYLLTVLRRLLEVAMETLPGNDSDGSAIQQLALYDIKLMCKIMGEHHKKTFLNVLERVMSLVTQDGIPAVVGSALLVEAEVVTVVRAHAIPQLPNIVNPLLDMLDDQNITENDLVLTCGLTALHRLVSALPHFLSPYLRRILTVVCKLSAVPSESEKSQADLRLAAIRHQLATVIAARVLIPTMNDTFTDITESQAVSKGALMCVMSVCKEHIETMSKDDLNSQHSPLLTLLCSALDLRNTNQELSWEDVSAVELVAVEAAMAMVVRLSEASFRPMFYKLYDWACREDTPKSRLRKLTFFNLADSLAAKLRGLFNLFVGHALQAACAILTANNSVHGDVAYFDCGEESARLSCDMVSSILACLTKCMSHDTEGIFSGEIFNMLLQPLVDQVENFVGSEADYESRMSERVVPCLAQFITAAKEDAHQKALNYQVLLKARHVSPKVRFGALRVISGMAAQMGDEYVILLPETIPFLAELMEDESEEVERECQQVIANLEDILGESLQKYF